MSLEHQFFQPYSFFHGLKIV
ncbi:MAG: hypothetical protein JWP79_2470, partial [Polaromonas sp.]|nr:hypothetical protein [Polaromonas sp.]